METKIKMKKICIALLIFSIAAAGTASAASVVSVVPSNQNVAPGATFSVIVNIDSESENRISEAAQIGMEKWFEGRIIEELQKSPRNVDELLARFKCGREIFNAFSDEP